MKHRKVKPEEIGGRNEAPRICRSICDFVSNGNFPVETKRSFMNNLYAEHYMWNDLIGGLQAYEWVADMSYGRTITTAINELKDGSFELSIYFNKEQLVKENFATVFDIVTKCEDFSAKKAWHDLAIGRIRETAPKRGFSDIVQVIEVAA